jgi:hypothetical protein
MARPSDDSANGAPGLHRGAVDRRAPVGSSSTRPSPTSGTPRPDAEIFEEVLDQLIEDATCYLDEAGLPPLRVRLDMGVEYLP